MPYHTTSFHSIPYRTGHQTQATDYYIKRPTHKKAKRYKSASTAQPISVHRSHSFKYIHSFLIIVVTFQASSSIVTADSTSSYSFIHSSSSFIVIILQISKTKRAGSKMRADAESKKQTSKKGGPGPEGPFQQKGA